MKSSHIATFFVALLVGGLFCLSLFSMRGLQKLEAAPLVRKALDEPQRGEEYARRAGEVLNGDATTAFALARWLTLQRQPKLAVVLLQQVVADPGGKNDALAWAGLAQAAALSNNPALYKSASEEARLKAEATLARVNTAKSGDAKALQQFQNVGTYLSERDLGNSPKKAIIALREALRLTPNTSKDKEVQAQALNALGYVLADRGDSQREFDEAVTLTQQALQKDPDNPMIMDSYGWALFKQGKSLPMARRLLRSAVDIALTEPELRYHLAAVCLKLNLKDEARIELERALKLAPGNAVVQALLTGLEAAPKAKP